MTSYETTLIFDPDLLEEGWEKAVERYGGIITGRNGIIKRTDRWGLRRMAYEIRKKSQGFYVQFIHESPPEVPREIERQCLLDETCLRYLTIVSDNPRYMEEQDKRQAVRESAQAAIADADSRPRAAAAVPSAPVDEPDETDDSLKDDSDD